ncbi:RAB6-interacting golgin [Drosophila sulfurigaster albostrigata]|uniref:RAB6-interacting golgin n=1 Tax=Drosophila sulfurigaster albostrigata TaxID=89887 RepID=UPI002D21898A|nr:RAB6-interacting golgin [Drosophila sulfurigaster albostrigata]
MAEKFNGFSHDEILKITGHKQGGRANNERARHILMSQPGIRRMPDKTDKPDKLFRQADQLRKQQQSQQQPKSQQQTKSKSRSTTPTAPATPTPSVESFNLDGGLSESLVQALYCGPINNNNNNGKAATSATSGDSEVLDDSSIIKLGSIGNDNDVVASAADSTIDSANEERLSTDSPFKGISLKDFEQHRKMIEEQNKQKKQMLYKAIEQHTQKTAAESRKIEEIRHELSKLESDLAVDVALLRKQIDTACIHFANVEKQYVKIEAQFLKAKIDLHNASEKKELLTEHLCTVIAHNEDRKAQKLTELMQKVGLTPTEDDEPESAAIEIN